MHIGLIGLGKMGGNMRERLRRGGHTVTGFDRNPDVSDVASMEELVAALPSPEDRLGDGPVRGPDSADRSPRSTSCSATATSSSTAGTLAGPTTRSTRTCSPRTASSSSTAVSPAAYGDSRSATR